MACPQRLKREKSRQISPDSRETRKTTDIVTNRASLIKWQVFFLSNMYDQENQSPQPWQQPNPLLPYEKPAYRRGCDGETAVRIILPETPSSNTIEAWVPGSHEDRLVSLKRSFFTAFDAYEAQDKALENLMSDSYDREQTPPPPKVIKQRRDSMQDMYSMPSSQPTVHSASPALPISPAPTELSKIAAPQIVTPSTEEAPPKRESSAPVPKALEIDGKAGFDPHKDDGQPEEDQDVIKTYLWKGRRYEVQGDEPAEWLIDVKTVPRHPQKSAGPGLQPPRDHRSLSTPGSVASSRTGRTRRSLRSIGGDGDGRRRSSRRG